MLCTSRTATYLAATLFLASSAAIAHAGDAVSPGPLLDDPARLAAWLHDHDPGIVAAGARLDAAIASRAQAGVAPNPQLATAVGGFVLGATNPSTPRLGLNETTNVSVGISEVVELGKRGPRQHAAALRVDEAMQSAAGTLGSRLTTGTAVLGKLAYVTARRAAVAANLDAARALLSLEQVRFDHKDLSGSELARIELDTQEVELLLGRADADVAVAVSDCGAVLFAACSTDGLDAAAALDAGAPLPAELPDARAAVDHRPAREATRLEVEALGADAQLAGHRAIPDPTVGVTYSYDNATLAGNQPQTLMLSLSVPLPLFDRGNHDAAAARANARALVADDAAVIRQEAGRVESLLAQRAMLEATLTKLASQAVPRSTQIVQQTRRAFDLGQAGLADLLLAERAHRDLLLEVLDTRFDLFNVRTQLRQVLGLDDQTARAQGVSR